jgi:4-methyl-5(b-hydroxyethyl)-thiazole monophosphate biosynthesis
VSIWKKQNNKENIMASVLVPLAPGFEELEAVALIDVMRRGGIEVTTAYIEDELHKDMVLGANGIVIKADTSIKNIVVDDFDMMVLPGGWGGTHALAQNDRVKELLRAFKESKMVGAICAAPFALKAAGVLGEKYTCYPSVENDINQDGYISDQKVVIDDNVMTSRGPGTAVCFGLAIVEKLVGGETKEQIQDGMLLDYCK